MYLPLSALMIVQRVSQAGRRDADEHAATSRSALTLQVGFHLPGSLYILLQLNFLQFYSYIAGWSLGPSLCSALNRSSGQTTYYLIPTCYLCALVAEGHSLLHQCNGGRNA